MTSPDRSTGPRPGSGVLRASLPASVRASLPASVRASLPASVRAGGTP